MTKSISIITEPSDINLDGIRILAVDLDNNQSLILSKALKNLDLDQDVILYVALENKDWNWLLDKKHKADLIFFNAESNDHICVGYLTAQYNAYYFGVLKCLQEVNKRAIYTVEDIIFLMENISKKHE